MEFKVLGPVEVMGESGPTQLGGAKPRALLGVLLAHLGRWVSIDRLIDEMWGDDPPTSAVNTLQSYLSRLRRGLGADRLVSGMAGYKLVTEDAVCDAAEFERLVEEAVGARDPKARRKLLIEALSLWRGGPYEDVADTPAIIAERTRLSERRLVAVEWRVAADLDLGEHEKLVSELELLVDEHPWREALWGQLMLACYRGGRQADALAAYRRLRNLLAEELGIEPAPAIRRLEEQILLQDPALDLEGRILEPSVSVAPASGTVTFLFTDIEGSTSLWEDHPTAMGSAVEEHDRILRSVIEAEGGYVFSSAGDSHAAAFRRAGQALRAAIDGQLALREVAVGGLPLPVRMGIHVGEGEERDGDYFGPVLNRVGRLRDAANGGQIVLSQAVEELIRDGLPDRVELLELGVHRLRDLARPERVYQVIHPRLPAAFPLLRTLDATRHNLPIQLTSFVGRDQEMAEVQKLLVRARLVTLTGAGGAGKTRLALQVAAEIVNLYPDGVWFVDLAPLTDPELVTSELTRVLGVEVGIGQLPLFDIITDYVRQRRMLVILDNCEHLIEPAAALAAHLVRHTELVTMLATSREHLAVTGETTYPVPPLSTPTNLAISPSQVGGFPAVRLFAERAQAVRRGFEVTDANAAIVAHICSQLDGLPMALELAAARLRLLTPAELAARLDDSFSVLGSAAREVPPHQRTLEATLDWSFDLLTRDEQKLFIRLSVFAGGWTLDAAEQICTGDGIQNSEVLVLFFGLADKSLVIVDEDHLGTRYRFLEPLRQYAVGKLVGAERESVRRRHGEFFTALATESFDEMWGENEIDWLERLAGEHDNLRTALAWCLDSGESQRGLLAAGSLYRFWMRDRHHEEGYRWLTQMLDADPTPTLGRARALLGAGTLARPTDQLAGSLLDEAIELFEQKAPTSRDLLSARNNRAVVASDQEDWTTATTMHEAILEVARQQGDSSTVANTANGLVELVVNIAGDLLRGTALAEESLEAARLTGSPGLLAGAWGHLGWVRTLAGDLGGAASALHEAREIEDRLGEHLEYPGNSSRWLGVVAFLQGDLNQATHYIDEAIRQLRRLQHIDPRSYTVRGCLQTLASIEAARSRYLEAAVLLGAAESAGMDRSIEPYDRGLIEEARSTAIHALGPDPFDRAFAEGSTMTLHEAIDYALGVTDSSQGSPDHEPG